MANSNAQTVWQLGPWQVYPALNRLQNEQAERALEPRVMAALLVLIDAQGAVVSDEQLLAGVWRGQIVSDASLYKVIGELRKALGDSDKPYQFIERVSGKGYRLLVSTSEIEQNTTVVPAPATEEETQGIAHLKTASERIAKIKSLWWLLLGVVVLIVLTVWQMLPPSATLPHNSETKTTPTTPPAAEQKPADLAQADWDNYLQARWLSAQRKPTELTQAVSLFQQVLTAAPNFAAAEVGLCNAYHFLHWYSDWPLSKVMALCEPLLRHALQTDASSAAALASFGLLKLSQGDHNAAGIYLDKSLALAPDDANTLMWRAQLYRQQGWLDKALPLIERAAQRDPLSGLIKRHYAFSLINSGNIGQARKVFQEALLLEPDYSDRAFDELDMLPLTIARARNYLRWAQRFPDRIAEANNPAPAINLALIQLSVGQIAAADRSLKIAEHKFPQHQYALLARAMWHSANHDDAAAQPALQQRAALQPNNPMYAVIALMYSAQNDPHAAQQQFLQLFPAFAHDPQTAVRNHLNNGQGQLVMFWLLTQNESERTRYADSINTWLTTQTEPDNLSLNLHLLLGQTEQANALAMKMLGEGWLPSPNDDFYLAEQHPVWRRLDKRVFERIVENRKQVLTR